jgi:hypothetical protein
LHVSGAAFFLAATFRHHRSSPSFLPSSKLSQEDAHLAELDIDGAGTALFAVFDGHGGGAVSKFAAAHMGKELAGLEEFKKGDLEAAITRVHYRLDELLETKEGTAKLEALAGGAGAGGGNKKKGKQRGLFSGIEDAMTSETTGEEKQRASKKFVTSALSRASMVPANGEAPL